MTGAAGAHDEQITVVVVDDHPLWRDGVRSDLTADGRFEVVAEAGDGGEAVEAVVEHMPDVVLMDLQLPTVSGTEAIRRIAEAAPHVRVLVLSASGEEADVLEAVKAGASGYLLKTSTSEELLDALARAHRGEPVFTPSLAGLMLEEFRRLAGRDSSPAEPALTPRENDVLRLVAKGYGYREIGERLFVSTKTVQNHVQNILAKLQLRKRYELMAYAIRKGIDRLPEDPG